VYLHLFRNLEASGRIKRGLTSLIEVSSGNAGASFAWFCKQLGYPCTVILPKGLPAAFVEHVHECNPDASVVLADEDNYVLGAVHKLESTLKADRRLVCLNHSRRSWTLDATEGIAREAVLQLDARNVHHLDYYVAACGNGATVVGPGRILKATFPKMKLVVFETARAPVYYRLSHPLDTSTPSTGFRCHSLFGTGAWGVDFPFMQDERYGFSSLVDDDFLVDEEEVEEAIRLSGDVGVNVGNTSLVALYLVKRLASREEGRNFLVLFYDRGDKYGRGRPRSRSCN
jgi:cysteine synthase